MTIKLRVYETWVGRMEAGKPTEAALLDLHLGRRQATRLGEWIAGFMVNKQTHHPDRLRH